MEKLPGKESRIIGSLKPQREKRSHKIPVPPWAKNHKQTIAIVITVLIGAGVGFYFWHNNSQTKNEAKAYNVMIKQVDDNLRADNQSKAKQLLLSFLATKPKDDNHLYNIEIRLATIYQFNSDYRNAKLQGQAALKHTKQPTLDVYIALGESSQQLNETKDAINYYNKALEILKNQKNKSPGNSSQIQYLSAIVAGLESEGQQ